MYRGQCPLNMDFTKIGHQKWTPKVATKSGQVTSKNPSLQGFLPPKSYNFYEEKYRSIFTCSLDIDFTKSGHPKVDIALPPTYIRDPIFSRFFAEISWYRNSLKCIFSQFSRQWIFILFIVKVNYFIADLNKRTLSCIRIILLLLRFWNFAIKTVLGDIILIALLMETFLFWHLLLYHKQK